MGPRSTDEKLALRLCKLSTKLSHGTEGRNFYIQVIHTAYNYLNQTRDSP